MHLDRPLPVLHEGEAARRERLLEDSERRAGRRDAHEPRVRRRCAAGPHLAEPLRRADVDVPRENLRAVSAQGHDRARLGRRHRRLRSEPHDHARREDAAHELRLQPVRRAPGDGRDRHGPLTRPPRDRERRVRRPQGRRVVPETRHQSVMLVVRSHRVVLPEGERAAALHVNGGIIERVLDYGSEDPTGAKVFNVPDLVISPGIVDTHVHINEPGRAEWEGFDTATRAAAAGGVTTLVDMPLNSVPATTTVAALHAKVDAARAQCHVDVGFWGGVVPGNAGDLDALVDAGARGFKCFLVPSGVDEFPAVTEDDLRLALPILARRGVALLVHAEIIADRGLRTADSNPQSAVSNPQYSAYLATRPVTMELDAIRLMIR